MSKKSKIVKITNSNDETSMQYIDLSTLKGAQLMIY